MDILSYLIGKKSASGGGGGGSSDVDWEALGYEGTPSLFQESYNRSLEIKNNWDGNTKMSNDLLLVWMPLVDCSTITDGEQFFGGCSALRYVPALNMESLTTCRYMFKNCSLLKEVDFSNFNGQAVTRTDNMFENCYSLEEIDLSSFHTTTELYKVNNMFMSCTSVRKIDIRNMVFSQITSKSYYSNMFYSVPTDCLIIVKDNTEKTWMTEKFDTLTNVKTVEEYNEMSS